VQTPKKIRFATALPMTALGKVDKCALRQTEEATGNG
jgi:acyl-coenzyme A synthetase/AMP-(fatty) acid ligase